MNIKDEEVFKNKIISYLKKQDFSVKQEVVVGKTQPDIFFITPSGTTNIVEVKLWEPTQDNISRARNMVNTFHSTAGTTSAFIVLPGDFKSEPGSNVLSFQQF